MNKFLIHILNGTSFKSYGLRCRTGEIIIGDYKETFEMPLEFWKIKDYKNQWQEGIDRLKTHNRSCLVSEIRDPAKSLWIMLWVLYKEADKVYIQNNLLHGKRLKEMLKKENFNSKTCYNFLLDRETISECGMAISEWSLEVKDFFGPSFVH